jgi:hypothetical protein
MLPCVDLSSIFKTYKGLDIDNICINFINNTLSFKSPQRPSSIRGSITKMANKNNDVSIQSLNDTNKLIVHKEPPKDKLYCDYFKFSNLHNLIKCAKICGKDTNICKIYLMNEQPIVFEFNIGKLGNVKFYLNPNQSED